MKHTKLLMTLSAVFLGVLGITISFLPQEILSIFAIQPHPISKLIVQILGALYMGFAILNWMAKGNAIGGIYNRPIAIGNFMHFGVGAITLVKAMTLVSEHALMINILMACYAIFGVGFAFVFLKNPPGIAED